MTDEIDPWEFPLEVGVVYHWQFLKGIDRKVELEDYRIVERSSGTPSVLLIDGQWVPWHNIAAFIPVDVEDAQQ